MRPLVYVTQKAVRRVSVSEGSVRELLGDLPGRSHDSTPFIVP